MKLKTIAAILGALAVLYGCGTSQRALGRTESQRETVKVIEHTEYIPIEIELPPVPEIKDRIFTRDTSSHLENDYAVSDAIIHRDGTLEHSLSTKPQKRTETVKVPMIQRDSIVYQTEVVEKLVEKKLNWWQKFRQEGFFVLALLLLWAYRKKIIALIK